MPIYRLLDGEAFEPEHCEAMATAFERVLLELGLKKRTDPLCEMVAAKVIELGRLGVRDAVQLYERALAEIHPTS